MINRNIRTPLGIDAKSFNVYKGYFYHWIEHYKVVSIVGHYAAMMSSAALPSVWLGEKILSLARCPAGCGTSGLSEKNIDTIMDVDGSILEILHLS
jgi:hypothetical protein